MPSLAFCSESPFVPGSVWSADPSDYVTNVPNVTFHAIYTSQEDENATRKDPFRSTYLDTLYNGRCQLLESDIDMTTGTYITLRAVEDDVIQSKGLLVYFLNPGVTITIRYFDIYLTDTI